jgi:hypothetical protein
MEVETVWGKIKTRPLATRLTRTQNVLLKDNLQLKPLFEWLTNRKIRSTEDFKNNTIEKALNRIAFETEVTWQFKQTYIPMITFKNSLPFQGDFQKGIKEYLNFFHTVMYSPEKFVEALF